jgi:hypothetical protein
MSRTKAIEEAIEHLRVARARRRKQSHATSPSERASAEYSLSWAIDEVLKAAALPPDLPADTTSTS